MKFRHTQRRGIPVAVACALYSSTMSDNTRDINRPRRVGGFIRDTRKSLGEDSESPILPNWFLNYDTRAWSEKKEVAPPFASRVARLKRRNSPHLRHLRDRWKHRDVTIDNFSVPARGTLAKQHIYAYIYTGALASSDVPVNLDSLVIGALTLVNWTRDYHIHERYRSRGTFNFPRTVSTHVESVN